MNLNAHQIKSLNTFLGAPESNDIPSVDEMLSGLARRGITHAIGKDGGYWRIRLSQRTKNRRGESVPIETGYLDKWDTVAHAILQTKEAQI